MTERRSMQAPECRVPFATTGLLRVSRLSSKSLQLFWSLRLSCLSLHGRTTQFCKSELEAQEIQDESARCPALNRDLRAPIIGICFPDCGNLNPSTRPQQWAVLIAKVAAAKANIWISSGARPFSSHHCVMSCRAA